MIENGWHGRVQDWVGILLCMATARSAAMAFNRLADRRLRCAQPPHGQPPPPRGPDERPLGRGLHAGLRAGIRRLDAVVPAQPLALVPVRPGARYGSWAIRTASGSPAWLISGWALSLSLAPIAAWIALRGDLEWPPVLLALAVLLWVSGFDIIYACQDVDFDRSAGLRSVPKTFGVRRALWIAAACHALMIVPLVGLGLVYPLGPIYFLGVAAVAALLVYEHALVRPDDLTRVNVAFFQVNVVISMGLLVVAVVDLLV